MICDGFTKDEELAYEDRVMDSAKLILVKVVGGQWDEIKVNGGVVIYESPFIERDIRLTGKRVGK